MLRENKDRSYNDKRCDYLQGQLDCMGRGGDVAGIEGWLACLSLVRVFHYCNYCFWSSGQLAFPCSEEPQLEHTCLNRHMDRVHLFC